LYPIFNIRRLLKTLASASSVSPLFSYLFPPQNLIIVSLYNGTLDDESSETTISFHHFRLDATIVPDAYV